MPKRISVVIPAYNAAKYLGEALDSVTAQTYAPLEIIIVDDGSTDTTPALVNEYGPAVKYFYQANQGIGAARNTGVRLSAGEYISFLDADDFWRPDKLEQQIAVLNTQPDTQMVFAWVQQFISPELSDLERQKWNCPAQPMPGLSAGTLLMRKEDFDSVGCFRTDLKNSEFIEWYGRAQALGLKSYMREEVLMYRRIHGRNTMLSAQNDPQEALRAVRAVLEMKRKKAGASQ